MTLAVLGLKEIVDSTIRQYEPLSNLRDYISDKSQYLKDKLNLKKAAKTDKKVQSALLHWYYHTEGLKYAFKGTLENLKSRKGMVGAGICGLAGLGVLPVAAIAGETNPGQEIKKDTQSNTTVYWRGDEHFEGVKDALRLAGRNIYQIEIYPVNKDGKVGYIVYTEKSETDHGRSLVTESVTSGMFEQLPSSVKEQISKMMAAEYAEKDHKPKENGKRFYVDYGLNARSDNEGLTVNAEARGLMRVFSEEGKLVALQLEGAYGRTEGGIEEIALAAGPVVKLVTESGRVVSIAGFYQWLEKNGYDAGSVQHSQIGIALGTEKNKDKFRLYVGLPLSDKQLEKSTSSSSTTPTIKETDTYVETTYTKTTTINEWVQEAVFNLTLELEHWFNERVAGKVGVFYANGVEYYVRGVEHKIDSEIKGILGGIIKLSDSLRIDLEAKIGKGKHAIDVYGGITYIFGSKSSNGKNIDGGQKARNEKSQEKPELLVHVETEDIETVRYEQVREIVDKTVATDYKATIEDLILSVDVNDLTASWTGKDLNGDEITLYRYKVESENSSWTETQNDSVIIKNIKKGKHIFYIQAYSNGKWGPVLQEGFDIDNQAPTIDISDISLNEEETKKVKINLDDPDLEDVLKLATKNLPSFASLSQLSDRVYEITLSPSYDKAGTYQTTFVVTDSDGKSKSKIITITVGNTNRVPTVSLVNAFPNDPVEGIHDVAVSYVFKDADGDLENILTKREWFKDDVLQSAFNGRKTIDKDELSPGEWYVEITPHDGEDFGDKVRSDTITVHKDEPEPEPDPGPPPPPANQAPTASNVDLNDNPIAGVNDIVLSYDYSDADGHAESGTEIRWFKDDVLQSAYNDLTTVPKGDTNAGEDWYGKVKPKDGTDFGTEVQSDTVTVQAAPPPPPP